MELFLAEIKYEKSYYEGRSMSLSMTRIVQASDAAEAYNKASKFISDQTDKYSIYYRAIDIGVSEVIK